MAFSLDSPSRIGLHDRKIAYPAPVFLDPSPSPETSPQFAHALADEPSSRNYEQARIEYLLERIHKSPYNFIRNGRRYNGSRAWIHIKWKYLRNRDRVETAEDFIQRVATHSKTSGERYLMELDNRTRYPLASLLANELDLFDRALEHKRAETS